MKTPSLLLLKNLLKPCDRAYQKIELIENEVINKEISGVILEGQFVLIVSAFEIVLTEILQEILSKIPEKIPKAAFNVNKDLILLRNSKLVDEIAARYIMSLSYSNLTDYFEEFCALASIDEKGFEKENIEKLIEIKQTRNLLLHNDLNINEIYKERAGRFARVPQKANRLEISIDYYRESSHIILALIKAIKDNVRKTYQNYTRYNALKTTWEYIFNSSILNFDTYWAHHIEDDSIYLKDDNFHGGISGSEKIFLGLWLNHYNGSGAEYLSKLNMHSLDYKNQQKISWLLKILGEIYF